MKNLYEIIVIAIVVLIFLGLNAFEKVEANSITPSKVPVYATQIASKNYWKVYRIQDGSTTLYVIEGNSGNVSITK